MRNYYGWMDDSSKMDVEHLAGSTVVNHQTNGRITFIKEVGNLIIQEEHAKIIGQPVHNF